MIYLKIIYVYIFYKNINKYKSGSLLARYWVLGFSSLGRVIRQWSAILPALDPLARHLLGATMYLLRPVARSLHAPLALAGCDP